LASIEFYATGRRKTSSARVFLRPGTGAITVNHRAFENFFPTDQLRMQVRRPLVLTETGEKFDILATVAGGGVNGQAGAIRLGISRALVASNAELRRQLKKDGLLTSDSRIKERKKYGMAGARKRFQFSKR
jgi:small subunit ribosomal protein S9